MGPSADRVALVTGAARGIGAATVTALAASGWRVVAADRCADDPALPYPLGSRDELDRVAASACAAAGDQTVVAVQADTRDAGALTAAVGLAEDRWGGLDAAIAAAGVIAGGVPAWQLPPEQEQAVLDIDLGGVLALARVAVPALLRRPEPRHGRFLAVASAAATRGRPPPRPADARRVLRGQSRSGRLHPRPRRRAGRDRRHRERGQPRFDGHPDAGRKRPDLRPGRRRGLRGAATARTAA